MSIAHLPESIAVIPTATGLLMKIDVDTIESLTLVVVVVENSF
jgi:hypothetical protein